MTENERVSLLVEHLREMELPVMAGSLEQLHKSKEFATLDRAGLLEALIGDAYQEKMTKQYESRLTTGNLKGCPQTIDKCKDSADRCYLPTGIAETLSSLNFIKEGLNICILGPSNSGKSFLAKALGVQACTKYRTAYFHCEEFLEMLVAVKVENYKKFKRKVNYFKKFDLLILDDFLLHTLTDEREVKILFEIMEKRAESLKSTIVCSQREPNSWPSMILNDEVSADSIKGRATKHYTVVIKPQ